MNFNKYQEKAKEFAIYPGHNIFNSEGVAIYNMMYPALGLAEEAGEVCGKLAKEVRQGKVFLDDEKGLEVMKELGDVLWNLAMLSSHLGYDLEEVAKYNIQKLESRKERQVLDGKGDDR